MGVCLSCHRRKRRGSEKHKAESESALQGQAREGRDGKEERADLERDPLCSPCELEAPRGHAAIRTACKPEINCCEAADAKQPLTLTNGHIISISKCANKLIRKDNSYSGNCDSFSSDLINVKVNSRDSVTMANAIANMKMNNPIKGLVSKRRKRYTKDGFNLDLTYITEKLIAMGFPAENIEGMYRNHIDDVFRLLEDKHKDHYKIYNLCSERSYDSCKFHKRVAVYAFDDHNPPKIELIRSFCEDVQDWLASDPRNVAAVHCKAGKGRTGTMICCYMLHSGQFKTAAEALNYYGQKRTHDRKGVTIPSQRRYVEYYAALLGLEAAARPPCPVTYRPPALLIMELLMQPPPTLNGGQGTLEFCVSEANSSQKISLGSLEARKGFSVVRKRLDRCTPLVGDIKVEVYNKSKIRKEKLFHFWFNTFFITQEVNAVRENAVDSDGTPIVTYKLTLDKWQIDDAHKDKQNKLYSSDFKVELVVQPVPENSAWGARAAAAGVGTGRAASPPSPPSASSSATDDESEDSLEPEEGWDSGGRERGERSVLGHYQLLSEPDLEALAADPNGAQTPEAERILHA